MGVVLRSSDRPVRDRVDFIRTAIWHSVLPFESVGSSVWRTSIGCSGWAIAGPLNFSSAVEPPACDGDDPHAHCAELDRRSSHVAWRGSCVRSPSLGRRLSTPSTCVGMTAAGAGFADVMCIRSSEPIAALAPCPGISLTLDSLSRG